jgi:hypothetical protein
VREKKEIVGTVWNKSQDKNKHKKKLPKEINKPINPQ